MPFSLYAGEIPYTEESTRGRMEVMAPSLTPDDPLPHRDTDLLAWRKKALSILLWVIAGARTIQLLYIIQNGWWIAQPSAVHVKYLTLYGLLIAVAAFQSIPHLLRGWFLLSLGYLVVTTTFWTTGAIAGQISLTLLAIPIYAAILLGRRSAWTAVALSLAAFLGMTMALNLGLPRRTPGPTLNPLSPTALFVSWVAILVPVTVLQDRFTALLQRLGHREKAMRLQLEAEARERTILEGALLEASERERQAVGHELHDGVCQQITGAMLHCKAVEKTIASGAAPSAGSIQAIASMLDASLGQVHDLARGLSSGSLTVEALAPSLHDLARRTRETFEVDCTVEVDAFPKGLEPLVATHLYRIAQEALVNAVKHGQPSCIQVRLRTEAGGMVLEVSNDGRMPAAASRDGMGLRIMRHRSELIGGTFTFQGADHDIRIRCSVPVPA